MLTQVTWIPEKYAKLQKLLKLKNDSGEWDDGWIVTLVGSNKIHEKHLPDYRSQIRGHRKKTGDSQRK